MGRSLQREHRKRGHRRIGRHRREHRKRGHRGNRRQLGRLDTENDTVTEWPVSDPATSPGDIQVRPFDGVVFFTSASVGVGELRQFDPQSQLLLKWPLPLDVPRGDTPDRGASPST